MALYFIRDEHASAMDGYEMILGCDAFAKLPPLTFDFVTRNIVIGHAIVPMENNVELRTNLAVRAAENIILKPGTQHIVKAKVDSIGHLCRPVIVDELDNRLIDEDLGLLPSASLNKNSEIKMIICNPTNKVKSIHKNIRIAIAHELNETQNPKILSQKSKSQLNLLRETKTVEADPSFKIDYTKCSVTGEEFDDY